MDNELRHNVALRVEDTESADTFLVSGRGELHLAILIETMRREGYEFHISRPEVILRDGPAGEKLEPFEEVHIETSPETVGVVVEMLGKRRGQLMHMQEGTTGTTHLTYIAPTRGLLGFRYQFLTATRGMGVMHSIFHDYLPLAGPMVSRFARLADRLGNGHDHDLWLEERRGARRALSWTRHRSVSGDGRRRAPAAG